jgi:NAD(P)-dependent dehydrogenase (short-subunit alcohol dehydrogenase family)
VKLEGSVALVTGGARGLGAAIVRRLAEEGAAVLAADVTAPDGRWTELSAGIRRRVEFKTTDVRDASSVEAAVAAAVALGGNDRLDILVNNAALFTGLARTPITSLTTGDWEQVMAVNVTGAFHAIRASVAPMQAGAAPVGGRRQGRASIINVASNVPFKGIGRMLHYVASKGAIVAMTRAAAAELGPLGIRVNAVAPGYLKHDDFPAWEEQRDENVCAMRALSRSETPQDVVGAVAFLAGPDSAFITGQTLVVDGGEVYR